MNRSGFRCQDHTITHQGVRVPHGTQCILHSFCPEGFVGIGVRLGTDTLVQNFVVKTCRDTTDDTEKLDDIQNVDSDRHVSSYPSGPQQIFTSGF